MDNENADIDAIPNLLNMSMDKLTSIAGGAGQLYAAWRQIGDNFTIEGLTFEQRLRREIESSVYKAAEQHMQMVLTELQTNNGDCDCKKAFQSILASCH